MIVKIELDDQLYTVDLSQPQDISIPLNFNGDQPNHFDAERAGAASMESGQFIGDTRRGGSCNVDTIVMTPHCNGTHTECVGHILDERIAIPRTLKSLLIPSTLISVQPEKAAQTSDNYQPEKESEDRMITRSSLERHLENSPSTFQKGLIVRSLPNGAAKKSRRYIDEAPPFFSLDAMGYLSELPLEHLLVDIPSIDRMFDEGRLSGHHLFWNVPAGSHLQTADTHFHKTITEMLYIPNNIPDGQYIVNIQIPNFNLDAAPSRVLIYPVIPS